MLARARATFATDTAWMSGRRQSLKDADASLDKAFGQLLAD